jgi:ribosome-associated protein
MTRYTIGMIEVTKKIILREDEVEERFVRGSGPGGQHADRSATAVQLRFDVEGSPSLPDSVRSRLKNLAGSRLTEGGVLVIEASRFRSQERNRRDARGRLIRLIRKAARGPRRRRKTKPPPSAEERRLRDKQRQSEKKRRRGYEPPLD